jgi:hypothetical protein
MDRAEDSEWDARRCHVDRRPLFSQSLIGDNSAGFPPYKAPQAVSWLIDGQPDTMHVNQSRP